MCSSLSSSSVSLPSNNPFPFRRRLNSRFSVKPFFIRPRKTVTLYVSASIAEKNSILEYSWDKVDPDEYNGWAIVEVAPRPAKKRGFPTYVVIGIGASVAALLGLLAYFSRTKAGFRFQLRSPFDGLHGFSVPFRVQKNDCESAKVRFDVSSEDTEVPEDNLYENPEVSIPIETSTDILKERKERIIVPLTVDSTQQEALLALKKLKIIEDDASANELCTRREYARWLVSANSLLERSRKHRIIPTAALSGTRITAFDDVRVEDPDFGYIQALAEAGVIRSKLSDKDSSWNLNIGEGEHRVNFSPERFIARQDLVSWRAKLEYEVMPEISEEMLRKNIGFLDAKEISADALMELFMDTLADEKSILRAVFGQCKRLQPSKPCTNSQAAVALTSGRMMELVRTEISRLELEYAARQSEMEEVMSELLDRGEIKLYWERKLEEERSRGFEVELDYRAATAALEKEKVFQENALAELVKQKAALDCQRQLLSSLKEEVTEMSERLAFEKAKYIDEQYGVQDTRRQLEVDYEELVDTKSVLEAEIDALSILRSWVEDEARKSQARAKVLEEAGRRWKWDG